MKVTNIERMTQLGSSIGTLASVINNNLDSTALGTKISKLSDMTVADALNRIIILSNIVCGQADEARYYYADIELPYTEDTFPVEHR